MSLRISDFDIVIGHLWNCHECRHRFLEDPHSMLAGMKLTPHQLELLLDLARTPYEFLDRLSQETGLDAVSFQNCITHPRARLRHLGARTVAGRA